MASMLPKCWSPSVALVCTLVAGGAGAQSISLKTVPIATGEQFQVFPSRTLGMASPWVAQDDSLGDAFGNPARGARLAGTWFAASPTTYGDDGDEIGGRTLPLAFARGGERWFMTAAVAIQQLETPRTNWWWGGAPPPTGQLLVDNSGSNSYLHGSLGRRLGEGRTAAGVSAYRAELSALDGVGQLYASSASISQTGGISEVRLGALHELGGERRVEGSIARTLLDMTHDVVYIDWVRTAPTQPFVMRTRTEENRDRTETWSGMVRYTSPLEPDARFGVVLVANTKSHPKLPNYELVQIPRDPGNSTLFALGIGLSGREGGSQYAAEVMIQPGRSHTWAYADTATRTPTGTLRPGDKTVDNQFRFANWTLALGWQYQWPTADMQLGLRVNQYAYHLNQQNYLAERKTSTDEDWLEWSPSWGGGVKVGRSEIRYQGRFVAKGFSWPTTMTSRDMMMAPAAPGGDFLVAPTQPVNLRDFRVTLHQLMLVVPLSK